MTEEARFAPPRPSNPDSLVQHVLSLDYRRLRRFLATNIKPRYPVFLYKYKALATDATAKRAKQLRDILVESRLWLSSAKDFNDPFDLTARVVFDGDAAKKRQRFESLIAQQPEIAPGQRRAVVEHAMAISDGEWQERAKGAVTGNLRKAGISLDPRERGSKGEFRARMSREVLGDME